MRNVRIPRDVAIVSGLILFGCVAAWLFFRPDQIQTFEDGAMEVSKVMLDDLISGNSDKLDRYPGAEDCKPLLSTGLSRNSNQYRLELILPPSGEYYSDNDAVVLVRFADNSGVNMVYHGAILFCSELPLGTATP